VIKPCLAERHHRAAARAVDCSRFQTVCREAAGEIVERFADFALGGAEEIDFP